MRFSEKSFEIRFCAALSAALMPFNRNPQWFGLTQAQERKAGIDSMLRKGGRLLIFQFKSKDRQGRFRVEREQAEILARFTRRHKNSTFYVFGEAATTRAATKAFCIFKESGMCGADKVAGLFAGSSAASRYLTQYNHYRGVLNKCGCCTLGCFCPPLGIPTLCVRGDPRRGVMFLIGSWQDEVSTDQPLPWFRERQIGLPIGYEVDELDGEPIRSVEEFEQVVSGSWEGVDWNRNLRPGLAGLFLPTLTMRK